MSFYNGEIFDATKTLSKAIFENAEKEKPRISPRLVASYGKFAKIIETLEPKEIQKSQNGYIYDFGQNCAGVLELEIKGRKGQRITARHAEVLLNGELSLRFGINGLRFLNSCKKNATVWLPKQ